MPSKTVLPQSSTPVKIEAEGPDNDAPSPGALDRSRLTEQEKKKNHIQSEQKRRKAIRDAFDRLAEIVPGMAGQGRSEGLVLAKVVEMTRDEMEERKRLIHEIKAAGGAVDESYYLPESSAFK
ncbi:hypothetical protein MMC09_004603 [Bachmanniomyces sp. S44760]|nr:hypothetical protein [Bachmanniomyces sp. S44760]